jgi:hypothetical protein
MKTLLEIFYPEPKTTLNHLHDVWEEMLNNEYMSHLDLFDGTNPDDYPKDPDEFIKDLDSVDYIAMPIECDNFLRESEIPLEELYADKYEDMGTYALEMLFQEWLKSAHNLLSDCRYDHRDNNERSNLTRYYGHRESDFLR